MEEEGQRVIKLNIGNLAPFGFEAPEEIVQDVIRNLPDASGYTDSRGMFAPRKAIMQYSQEKRIPACGRRRHLHRERRIRTHRDGDAGFAQQR
jgi:alanine-synthesizing transaminase